MFWRGPPLTQRVRQTSSEMSQRFALQEAALCRTPSHLVQNTQGQTDESFVVKLNEYWPERFHFMLALATEHTEMKSSPSFLFLFLCIPVKNLNLRNTRSFSFVKSSSTMNTHSFMAWINTKKKSWGSRCLKLHTWNRQTPILHHNKTVHPNSDRWEFPKTGQGIVCCCPLARAALPAS